MKKNPTLLVVAAWAVGLLCSHAVGAIFQPESPHWFWGETLGPPSIIEATVFEPHTKALAEEVNNNFSRIVDHLDLVIQPEVDRIDGLDTRIGDNAVDISANASAISGNAAGIGSNATAVADLQGRTSVLETRMGAAEADIDVLQITVGDLGTTVANLDVQVSALEGRVLIVEDFILNVVPSLHGEIKFDTLGSHSWTVPAQVDSIVLTVVGAGGGSGTYGVTTAEGGDGASVWKREISVTPGEVLPIEIGAGGDSVTGIGVTGVSGGFSSVTAVSGTWLAAGGEGGTSPDGPLSGGTPGNSPSPHEGYAFRVSGQGSSNAAGGGDGIVILNW